MLPEISWNFDGVCRKIIEREQQGKHFTLVVVAEGAHLPDGAMVTRERRSENRQVALGGIGNVVAAEIQTRLGRETRCVVLGHLQRGGPPTTFDRVLATQFGAYAVETIHRGEFGRMVCFNPPAIESVWITEAVSKLRTVDPNCSAVKTARALGISFGDCGPKQSPPASKPQPAFAEAESPELAAAR